MRSALAFLAFVAACATSAPVREPFSIDAFLADANGYVASRYEARERPAALIADLESQDFQCQHSATVSECSRARHAFASCWDVINVLVQASGVSAESNRRCMGATQ